MKINVEADTTQYKIGINKVTRLDTALSKKDISYRYMKLNVRSLMIEIYKECVLETDNNVDRTNLFIKKVNEL